MRLRLGAEPGRERLVSEPAKQAQEQHKQNDNESDKFARAYQNLRLWRTYSAHIISFLIDRFESELQQKRS